MCILPETQGGETTYIPVNDTVVKAPVVFIDDFETDAVGEKANFWLERNTAANWRVAQIQQNRVYGTAGTQEASCSWLHIFETNVDLAADLFVPSDCEMPRGRVGLLTRLSGAGAYVLTGYDFSNGKWFVQSLNGPEYPQEERLIWAEKSSPFERDVWHRVRVRLVDRMLQLWHNDEEILKTRQIRQITTGRVALFCENSPLYADNVRLELLSGQGRVEEAVLAHYVISDDYYSEGGSLFPYSDELYLFSGMHARLYLSGDKGDSFRIATEQEREKYGFFAQEVRAQYIRLHNGWILKIDNYTGGRSYLSKDNGATYEQNGTLFTEEDLGGSWDYYGGMNDMLKELKVTDPDGTEHYRVFYCADTRATGEPDGSGHICYHWEEVYYTDDCGCTWHKCARDSRWVSGMDHFTESRIMRCSDGTLRMFCTYNETPCVRYLNSYDGGITWQDEAALPQIRCPRTSYHYAADEDGTIYLVFLYADPVKPRGILPRTRFSLIRSRDGFHWEYLMDIWRRDSIPGETPANIYQTVDPSITVTKDHVFVTAGWSEKRSTDGPHNAQCQTLVKLDKKKLKPYEAFPEAYSQAEDIVRITVTPPDKLEYRVGEPLDLSGGSVTVHYYGQEQQVLSLDAEGVCLQAPTDAIRYTSVFPAPDMNVPGEKWIRVTYKTFAATFCIRVR